MAVAESFAAVASKLHAVERDLGGAGLRKITTAVALDGKGDIRDQLESDLGTDRKFTNWKPRLDARFTVDSDSTATLEPTPGGPFKVLAFGRRGRSDGLPKRRSLKVYRTPWGPRTATRGSRWPIGPTRGRGTWTKAVRVIAEKTPERVDRHTVAVLSRHLNRG